MKSISSKKLEPNKIPFSIRKLTIFFILKLFYLLEYKQITKGTFLNDYKMILLKIKIPCDRNFSYSKVFCSKVKFTIVYCSIL